MPSSAVADGLDAAVWVGAGSAWMVTLSVSGSASPARAATSSSLSREWWGSGGVMGLSISTVWRRDLMRSLTVMVRNSMTTNTAMSPERMAAMTENIGLKPVV